MFAVSMAADFKIRHDLPIPRSHQRTGKWVNVARKITLAPSLNLRL